MNNTSVDELYAGEPKAEKEMSQRFRSHDLLDVLTDQGIQLNAPNSRDTIFFLSIIPGIQYASVIEDFLK